MMAGQIFHEFNGTILTITSDSGTSSVDLKGGKGDTGPRGAQGPAGVIVNPDGTIDTSQYATETYVNQKIAEVQTGGVNLSNYYTKPETDSLLNGYATKAEIPDTTGLASQTWVEEKGYLTTHQPLKTINGESIVGTGNITISGGSADLSNYYTKEQIDAKGYLTQHQSLKTINGESIVGTGNITIIGGSNVDLSDYYTKEQIDAKGYLTEHQSLAAYALKSEIPDVSGYLTLDTLPKYNGGVE